MRLSVPPRITIAHVAVRKLRGALDSDKAIEEEKKAADLGIPPMQDSKALSDMERFALISGKGFITYPHFDGGGYLTWGRLIVGGKLWVYIRSREDVHVPDVDAQNAALIPTLSTDFNARTTLPTTNGFRQRVVEGEREMAAAHRENAAIFRRQVAETKVQHDFADAPKAMPERTTPHCLELLPGTLL